MATGRVRFLFAALCVSVLAGCQAASGRNSGLTVTETDGITIASFTNPVKTTDYDYAYYGDVAERETTSLRLSDSSQTANYTNSNTSASPSDAVDQPRELQPPDEYYPDYESYNATLDALPTASEPSSEKLSPIDPVQTLENEAHNKSLVASSADRKIKAVADAVKDELTPEYELEPEFESEAVAELEPEPEPEPKVEPGSEAEQEAEADADYGDAMESVPPGFSETPTLPPDTVPDSDAYCRYEVEAAGKSKQKAGSKRQRPLNPPCFDSPSATVNMTVEHGSNAELVCQVRMLGKSSVTWWREGEAFPTAVGHNIFVRNDRLAVNPGKRDWNMIIRFVQPQDAGVYKCQINTLPVKSLLIRLNVVDELPVSPADSGYQINDSSSDARTGDAKRKTKKARSGPAKVEIRARDVVVPLGREAELTCLASGKKGVAPESVDWFFRGHKIKTSQRIAMMNSVKNHQLISVVRINAVTISDAGTYVCRSSEKTTSTYDLAVICVDGTNCGNLQTLEADNVRVAPVVATSGHGNAHMPPGPLLLAILLCASLSLLKYE